MGASSAIGTSSAMRLGPSPSEEQGVRDPTGAVPGRAAAGAGAAGAGSADIIEGPAARQPGAFFFDVLHSTHGDYMNRPGVPAPGFVKRIGPIVDARRETVFQELQSVELLNRLKPGPDGTGMPFGWTVNPFRGCEIGCTYCYARPTHEYLGHSDPEEFESRVYVKRAHPAPPLEPLRRARASGLELAIGTATDPYQPAEGRFRVTRDVLKAVAQVPGLRVGL